MALANVIEKLVVKGVPRVYVPWTVGADNIDLQVDRDIRSSKIENQRIFIDAEISVTASGRPRIT